MMHTDSTRGVWRRSVLTTPLTPYGYSIIVAFQTNRLEDIPAAQSGPSFPLRVDFGTGTRWYVADGRGRTGGPGPPDGFGGSCSVVASAAVVVVVVVVSPWPESDDFGQGHVDKS